MQNLALSDLLFVSICIPLTAVHYAIGWPFGSVCCKLVQYLIHVTTYSSVYTLVLLSLDRYLAVVYPVKSISLRTTCNTTVAILVTWVFTLVTCIPSLFVYDSKVLEYKHKGNRTVCTLCEGVNQKAYQMGFMLTSLALPLMTILWLYMNMLLRLWRGSAATHGPGPARDTNNRGKENKRRVTRMIVVVIIVFTICWSPLQFVLILRRFHLYDINSPSLVILQIVTQCLAYCNSCLNPILYAFFSPNFRQGFLNAVSCSRKGPRISNDHRGRGTGTAAGITAEHVENRQAEIEIKKKESFEMDPLGASIITSKVRTNIIKGFIIFALRVRERP